MSKIPNYCTSLHFHFPHMTSVFPQMCFSRLKHTEHISTLRCLSGLWVLWELGQVSAPDWSLTFQIALLYAAAGCVKWQWVHKVLPSPWWGSCVGTPGLVVQPDFYSNFFTLWSLDAERQLFAVFRWATIHLRLQSLSLWWILQLIWESSSMVLPECFLNYVSVPW